MSTGVAVGIGVGAAVALLIVVLAWMFWTSRVGTRPAEKPEEAYLRVRKDLHSPRNVRVAKAKERRKKAWAAGTAGAIGAPYIDPGGCSGAGCGGGCGGGGGGGGGGCGGS